MKKLIGLFMVLIILVSLLGCTDLSSLMTSTTNDTSISNTDTETELTIKLKQIYDLGVTAGTIGITYEEWLESIKGESGEDGREIVLQVTDDYLQWRYATDVTWTNLLSIASIVGHDGADGKSAYEIYLDYHPEYLGTEEDWINDLVNGNLVTNNTITIAFDLQGGSFIEPNEVLITQNKNTTVDLPDVYRVGYKFMGWVTGFDVDDHLVSETTIFESSTILYAVWEEIQVTELELPSEEITVTFWHVYGTDKSALLNQMIAEFEAMYPNVTIVSQPQSDYNTLREKINTGLGVGQVPTMALGYPDHFAAYIQAGGAYSLNSFINSDIRYVVSNPLSSIYGDYVDVSIDLEDFIPGYLAENSQYVDGQYYSMPFSKSTETMAVNRTVIKHHVAEIRDAGINVSDEGFFSHTMPLTFQQIQTLGTILLNETTETDVTNYQCAYLLNYDSSGNMFINMSRQSNAPYTNSSGDILINNDTTKSMLNYINSMFNNRTFVLPIEFSQTYGSTNFKYGDICMTVGSTAGVAYTIPSKYDILSNLKFGIFDVDFLQVPQFVTEDNQAITLSDGTNNYNFTGSLSAVQQGPNIGIFDDASDNEKLFAWLFIKYLTNTENTIRWSMFIGYLPVRLSAYTSNVIIELSSTFSTTFAGFLNIASDYWAADGQVTWSSTDERWNYLYVSMVLNIAKNQAFYYDYDPAFPAGASSAGSATVRVEAGYCLENIYNKTKTPTEALNFFYNQVDW